VPLVVLPFQDSLGPLLAAWMQPWSKSADKKEGVDDSLGKRIHLQEQFITTAVLGERSTFCTAHRKHLHTIQSCRNTCNS